MALTNDYQVVANGGSANVESQAQFLADLGPGGYIQNGFQQGTAKSQVMNKIIRQVTMITTAIAQTISDVLQINILDDGNLTTLIASLKAAFLSMAWTTGDMKLTYKIVADGGWVMFNDGTIGSATSGATFADPSAQALFTLLWNNVSQPSANAWCTVVGGLGASAAADWAANKKLTMPTALGRVLAISGSGTGLTARALGSFLGAESHTLTNAEINHTHGPGSFAVTVPCQANSGSGGAIASCGTFGVTGTSGANTLSGNTAFSLMNPVTFMNAMIKL